MIIDLDDGKIEEQAKHAAMGKVLALVTECFTENWARKNENVELIRKKVGEVVKEVLEDKEFHKEIVDFCKVEMKGAVKEKIARSVERTSVKKLMGEENK